MRILVMGRSGQLATALRSIALPTGWHLIACGRPLLNVCDPAATANVIHETQPDVIINAAAFTAVDEAERKEAEALALNRDAPAALARLCAARDIPLVHISTDYVFDGRKGAPYVETDTPAPLNAYGRSKLAGEEAVRTSGARYVIVRTAWLFSPHRCNFLQTMLRLAEHEEFLRIVTDQYGSPTCALHLAEALITLLQRWRDAPSDFPWNHIWHLAGTGHASRFAWAQEIMRVSARLGGPSAPLHPITTADYPMPARRPSDSRLDCSAIVKELQISLPPWQEGVEQSVRYLLDQGKTR